MPKNYLRREQSLANQVLRAIQVGQDQIEQVSALGERGGQRVPFALGQQQRQGVEFPETVGPLGKAGHALQEAVFAEQASRLLLPLGEPRYAHPL